MDRITRLTASATLFTVIASGTSVRQSEIYSQSLSWLLLPVVFHNAKRPKPESTTLFSHPRSRRVTLSSVWVVATCISIAYIFQSEFRVPKLLPVLTPLLTILEKYFQCESPTAWNPDSGLFSSLASTIWGTVLVASVVTFSLSDGDSQGLALSAIPVAALLFAYTAFLPRTSKDPRFLPLVPDVGAAVTPLSRSIITIFFVILGAQTFLFGFTSSDFIHSVISGLAGGLSWYFMILLTQHTSWRIVTMIGTFSLVSTRNPFVQSSETFAFLHVVASLLVLGQIIYMLPKQATARSYLWALFLIPFIPYSANIVVIRVEQTSAQSSFNHALQHPVEILANIAEVDFENMLQRQSKTYVAAHEGYLRRYGIDPPPGFKHWYEFAVAHQSSIIDDYDIMYESISPFWKLSGARVLEIMDGVKTISDSELWSCNRPGNGVRTKCSHSHRSFDRHITLLFDTLLESSDIALPDVRFMVNHLDEPRIVTTPQSHTDSEANPTEVIKKSSISHRPAWEEITKICQWALNDVRTTINYTTIQTYDLPFVTDTVSSLDLCQHPEYSNMHGLAMSPTSLDIIEGLVPVLSTGSLSTMGDILFPSPAYIVESEFQYDKLRDVDWDQKRNNLYWAGSTTGSFTSNELWRSHHRQRFVQLAQNLETTEHSYLRENDGIGYRIKSLFLNSRLFDVAFTKIFQCKIKYCRQQKAYFNTKNWADKDYALQSKLVFDIDGNGISGRYYKLLASRSCPMKQTLFREWHDDRLIPWLHYIPVSQSLEELPELVAYLTITERGQQIAKEVADRGHEWFAKAFREIDMSIYIYRLLLELARLQDPSRQATSNLKPFKRIHLHGQPVYPVNNELHG